jgi:hypothetical protein
MSRLGRFPLFAFLLCLSGAALGACQALAGIDDRVYPSPQCLDYCTRIMAPALCGPAQATDASPNAPPTQPHQAYTDIKTCFGICALLPAGDESEPNGMNSVACRNHQLDIQESGGEETCASSGPGGNAVCGTNCESYCQLYKAACQAVQPNPSTELEQHTCVLKCQGLKDTETFDTDANSSGDTLQCRLYHTSAASVDPITHCWHAQLPAQNTVTPKGPCVDDPTIPPDCASFCQLEMAECQGPDQIYEDNPQGVTPSPNMQCMAVCDALSSSGHAGSVDDTTGNTIGCRKYHSYNAMFGADVHCQHTGPGSEGMCEDAPASTPAEGNCQSYCLLLPKACPSPNFKVETCEKDCAQVPAAPSAGYSYSVAPGLPSTAPGLPPTGEPTGNNVECRLLHVSRALSDPTECAAAEGTVAPCM